MTEPRTYDPASKDQVFDTLRREILAARLKVTLDEQLDRPTSPTVKRLAKMKLPPIVRMASVWVDTAEDEIKPSKTNRDSARRRASNSERIASKRRLVNKNAENRRFAS